MAWVMVGTTAATTALGYAQQKEKKAQQQNEMISRAEANKYSPYTNKSYDVGSITASPTDGALQGGIAGLAMSQQFGKSNPVGNVENKMSLAELPSTAPVNSGYSGLSEGGALGMTAGGDQFGLMGGSSGLTLGNKKQPSMYDSEEFKNFAKDRMMKGLG